MDLAVGVIAYNESSSIYLPFFLPSLRLALGQSGFSSYRLYVYDNSPAENGENKKIIDEFLHDNSDLQITYITTGKNVGFSTAYNSMISEARNADASYFLVINPDTILEADSLREMRKYLENDSSLGSVSPKILSWDFKTSEKGKKIDSLGIVLQPGLKFFDAGQGEDANNFIGRNLNIIGPSGAAGLFRMSALSKVAEIRSERVQYYDERFFMYKEDCDLAYRLFLAGYGSRLVETAIVYHDRTASSFGRGLVKTLSNRASKSRQVRSWSFLNQHLIFFKHWNKQSLTDRLIISRRLLSHFIFSLTLERFLFKEYRNLARLTKSK